jgi:hypothetical protein
MKREYKNLPNPTTEPKEFDEYLRKNNELILETDFWILIKNSFIENQLVCFSKNPYAQGIGDLLKEELIDLQNILSAYQEKHIYINALENKSIPNRFHVHIKL